MRKALPILLLAVMLGGCPAHNTVTKLPPNVTQQQVNDWTGAVNTLQKAQGITHQAWEGTLGLHNSGVLKDTAPYKTAIQAEGRAEQLEIELATFLKTVPNDWSQPTKARIATYTTQILAQLAIANAQGILGVKDPVTGQLVSQLISNSVTLVQNIQAAVAAFTSELLFNVDGTNIACAVPETSYFADGIHSITLMKPVPCEVKR